ncbi:MAG: beta-ACP synthase [Chitinophagales bacterium]|nr:MAG: beta-ACP synthase [Chitinophagales bacterium]
MSEKVYVVGTGIISAIGRNTDETVESLLNSRSGISPIELLPTVHRHKLPAGEIKYSNAQLAAWSGCHASVSRTALLALLAAREAKQSAGISEWNSLRTGLISATTVGGMDRTEIFMTEFIENPTRGRLRDVIYHDCGASTEIIADTLGIKDFITTISTACSSSANAIMYGARLIKHNRLDVAIAGGADALSAFTTNGFSALMILDPEPCKPFDANRKGLNLGEGAGYLTLVSERVAKQLKLNVLCELTGYGNANDAYHQTASSPEGTGSLLAMQAALQCSQLRPTDIDYINLHGTGTSNNDLSEGKAIKKLFSNSIPPISSTKSFTGHTLGASGGIEAVISVLAMKHQVVFPNLRFSQPIEELSLIPVTSPEKRNIRHVMSNAFGFGGNCCALIFSKTHPDERVH